MYTVTEQKVCNINNVRTYCMCVLINVGDDQVKFKARTAISRRCQDGTEEEVKGGFKANCDNAKQSCIDQIEAKDSELNS